MVDPELSAADAASLVVESDRIRAALADAGVTDADLSLRHELNEVEVTEVEMLSYYESQREHFGHRSFDECRGELRTLVGLRKVREKYSGTEQRPMSEREESR